MTIKFKPHGYQTQIVDYICENKRSAIFAFMGAGKSVSTLTAIDNLALAGEDAPTLIVAPLRVAKTTWPDEARKWEHLKHLSIVPVVGSEADRLRALKTGAPIMTTNYESLEWLIDHYGERWPFETVVCDEMTKIKSFRLRQGGRRAAALGKIAHTKIKRFVGLTGTPAPNGLADLWGQMWFIDRGQRLGRTYDAFRQRWFKQSPDGFGSVPMPHAQGEIEAALRDVCLTIDAKDWFDLKDPIVENIYIELPVKVRKLYSEMEKNLFMELESGHTVEAFNAAAKSQKLLQMCLAEGTEVLTKRGWVVVESVTSRDNVWDGIDWVNCDGVICHNYKEVVELDGVWMTANHKLLTSSGWASASEILSGGGGEKFNRVTFWDAYRYSACGVEQEQQRRMALPMRLWARSFAHWLKSYGFCPTTGGEVLWVQQRAGSCKGLGRAWYVRYAPFRCVAQHALALFKRIGQRLQKLRGAGDNSLRKVGGVILGFLGGYARRVQGILNHRAYRQQCGVYETELPMGDDTRAVEQHTSVSTDTYTKRGDDRSPSRESIRVKDDNSSRKDIPLQAPAEQMVQKTARVYDILNAGKNNRFLVRGANGELIISHNCSGAVYVDPDAQDDYDPRAKQWKEVHDAKIQVLEEIIEEANGAPVLVAYHFKSDLQRLLKAFPKGRHLDKDSKTIEDWNAGKIPVLFAHPASAGHGLSLQDGGNILVYFSHDWSLENRQQILERIGPVRQMQSGHDRPVFVYNILAHKTVDEIVLERMKGKATVQELFLQAMRKKFE